MGWKEKKKGRCITFLIVLYLFTNIQYYYTNNICSSEEVINNNAHKEIFKLLIDDKFIEWFVGLCEAESSFLIRKRKNENKEVIGFEFVFRITLHQDDGKSLEFIKNTLNCGRLNRERDVLVYTISKLSDIETILIPLFDKFALNAVKYLDYLDFKTAFFMFKNRIRSVKTLESVNEKNKMYNCIIDLADNMNSNRTNFNLPKDHSIRITINYLIGYLEGDGTFYLNKHDMSVHVSLATLTVNKPVVEKIREFLLNLLDEHSYILGSTTKLVNLSDKKSKGIYNKPITILDITQIDFICNIFIPYINNVEFRTKKYLDYLDFRTIAFLLLEGKYLTKKGKELIIKLGDSMNNNRLSTNKDPFILDENTKLELNNLIKSESLIHIDNEGRAKIISENKYIRSTYIIKAEFNNGLINYFTNGISCAKSLHVSNFTITARLNDGKPVKNKDGVIVALSLKRIKAYSS